MIASTDFNRSLAQIFSAPIFREVARHGTNQYFFDKLKKYQPHFQVQEGDSIKNVIWNAYGYLSQNYRNEYVYKNTILNKILLGKHNINTATLINEFRVGKSIADIVILNGTSTVYEIKTELDSPEKLIKQIIDYRKVFAKIYLVTHHTIADKYLSLIKNSSVGLLSLTGRFSLATIKEAEVDYSGICNETVIKSLRKTEYAAILTEHFGLLPQVPNIKFFSACRDLISTLDKETLHAHMLLQLRKRNLKEGNILASDLLPTELKHICLCIDPDKNEYNNLLRFINQKL